MQLKQSPLWIKDKTLSVSSIKNKSSGHHQGKRDCSSPQCVSQTLTLLSQSCAGRSRSPWHCAEEWNRQHSQPKGQKQKWNLSLYYMTDLQAAWDAHLSSPGLKELCYRKENTLQQNLRRTPSFSSLPCSGEFSVTSIQWHRTLLL